MPPPKPGEPDYTTPATPARGSISLSIQAAVPSLPSPQGIDSIVVTDPAGRELMRDDFNFIDNERWKTAAGSFAIEDGVLIATDVVGPNVLELIGPGFGDQIVTVTFRNGMAAGVSLRHSGPGGITYGFNLLRDFPNYLEAYDDDGSWSGTTFGDWLHTDKTETLQALGAMLTRWYPASLALLGGAFVIALVLSFAETGLTRRVHLPVIPPTWRARYDWLAQRDLIALAAVLVLAVVTAAASMHIISAYYSRVPHLPDEASYMFQAKLFAAGRITGPVPPVPEAFWIWIPSWLYQHGNEWATPYPFGQPLGLAPGALFDAMWVMPPLFGAGCVALIYAVGRRMYDARTGLVAAVVLAGSPFFLMQTSNFMSHTTWAFYLLASLFFLLDRGRPILFGVLAGVFFGLAVNTRTIESLMLVPPFAAVLLGYIAPKPTRRENLKYLASFLAGGALMLLAMLFYNWQITGDPLTSGYAASNTDAVLGFTDGHTLDIGLRNQETLLMALLLVLNNWPQWIGIGFIVLPFAFGTRNRWDWFCAVSALLVMLVYVLYKYSGLFEGPRYWYQAVPFLILLTARGTERAVAALAHVAGRVRGRLLGDARPALLPSLLVVYVFVAFLVVDGAGGWLFGWNDRWLEANIAAVPDDVTGLKSKYLADDRLLKLAAQSDLKRALVLVKGCGQFQSLACYDPLFLENNVTFDGEVVWARYIPGKNEAIVDAFPGRSVYVASWDENSIVPYDPATDR
ncbi:MAG TPA: glycosyltransferase family 39 protein [Dehalococcoidia bacterium]|nr:glycosyltransferase family 39 protein [Dehalococcoidia bacterium]